MIEDIYNTQDATSPIKYQLIYEIDDKQNEKWKNIPSELKELNQWVVWKLRQRDGRMSKVPYNPRRNLVGLQNANVQDPETWSDHKTSIQTCVLDSFDGIGFVLTEKDPYTAIDLDHCRNSSTGDIEDWAKEIIDRFKSYTEISPSGEGIRLFVRSETSYKVKAGYRKDNIEAYRSGRYVTVTGHVINEMGTIEDRSEELNQWLTETFPQASLTPQTVKENTISLEDEKILELAFNAKNGTRIHGLFNGELSGYGANSSKADMALAGALAFYSDEPEQIERIMNKSGLARAKWDSKRDDSTYLQQTIEKAIANRTEKYMPVEISKKMIDSVTSDELNKPEEIVLTTKKLPFLSVDDLNNLANPKWLIENYLEEDSLSVLYGASGIGKSFIALDWGLTIASGLGDWFGNEVESGHVIYVAAEGAKGLKHRINAWKEKYNCADLKKIHFLDSAIQFRESKEVDVLLENIKLLAVKPILIIVDTLARCSGRSSTEESSYTRKL